MREQLIQYVELLFAAAPNSDDIRQEILQNTLDRYDDLIVQGKSPEAAYRLSIAGIGDINEILGNEHNFQLPNDHQEIRYETPNETDHNKKKMLRAIAVALYILCPIPLFVLSELGLDTLGLCGLLVMVAAATLLIMMEKKTNPNTKAEVSDNYANETSPEQEFRKSIHKLIGTIGVVIYFIVSFSTGAWHLTWLIFPIIGCVRGLVNACLDLKEAMEYEE